jgi:hypothetical protein
MVTSACSARIGLREAALFVKLSDSAIFREGFSIPYVSSDQVLELPLLEAA